MAKVIEVNKNIGRAELDKELLKLSKKRNPIDLKEYFGKVKFGVEGLEYQQQIRNEWR